MATEKEKGWLNRTEMAHSLDMSPQGFDRWGVYSVDKIKNEKFYTVKAVLDNRLQLEKRKAEQAMTATLATDIDEMDAVKLEKMKAETRRLNLQNAILEGRSLPAWAVTEILTSILSQSAVIFDTLPATIQRQFPEIEKRIIDGFEAAIIQHQNAAASLDKRVEEVLESVIREAEERIR